mmetsp:Transcript_37823/g.55707  ORF Transcript_37823/g.55707 Transcript_37823/m.55707 type:complete len:137 (+) Transcript_37823:48-458(+)|eukprot:CAMPEP_0195508064 /NCGR_PEP_ID=MMETSP0794_2-20130614/1372_1 /TAXON_ID=515487 /ORGANISM="Stephanopyxis turris, Strain CCMP 815" /LENGTH=136 /DNA_ID=CAMNT_0040634929 /DNA_START=31 /DNA_END=441 /DNA_ORIENTATION=-
MGYDDYDWEELPQKVKDACTELGYTKDIWESDGEVPSSTKLYDDLTSQEKDLYKVLKMDKLSDFDWKQLTSDQQAAATVLGYTQEGWDGDKKNPIEEKLWKDLSPEEQEAAKAIGYTMFIWDEETDSESSSSSDED